MPEIYVVLDLHHFMVMLAVLRQQQTMQWFAFFPAQERRIESSTYQNSLLLLPKHVQNVYLQKKGCIYCFVISDPHCRANMVILDDLVLGLVWSFSMPLSAMHLSTTHSHALALARNSFPISAKCCNWRPYGMSVQALSSLCHRFLIPVLKAVSRRCEHKWLIHKDDGLYSTLPFVS